MEDFEVEDQSDEKPSKEEKHFPNNLEGRLNAILNVVNTEFKSLTVLHLDDHPATGDDIKHRIRQTIDKGYLPDPTSFKTYCSETLFPIGVVAREEVVKDENENVEIGYSLTEAGKIYGLPIAAFSLRYAVEKGMSLFDILGSTATKGKVRAPIVRAQLLKALIKGEMGIKELDNLLNTNLRKSGKSSSHHARSLQEKGLLNCIFAEEILSPSFSPTHKKGKPENFRHNVSGTKKIIEYLNSHRSVTVREVVPLLGHKWRGDVTSILNSLVKQGFASRSTPLQNGLFQKSSSIKLTKEGRRFVQEYIIPVENALSNGEYLGRLTEEYKEFVGDSKEFTEVVRQSIDLYRKASPRINKKPVEDTRKDILSYLGRNPGARPLDIIEDLEIPTPYNHLAILIKSGKIISKRVANRTAYYLADGSAREQQS